MVLGATGGSGRQLDPLSGHGIRDMSSASRELPNSIPLQGLRKTASRSQPTSPAAPGTSLPGAARARGTATAESTAFRARATGLNTGAHPVLFSRPLPTPGPAGAPLAYRLLQQGPLLPVRAKQGPLAPLLLLGSAREQSAPSSRAGTCGMPPEPPSQASHGLPPRPMSHPGNRTTPEPPAFSKGVSALHNSTGSSLQGGAEPPGGGGGPSSLPTPIASSFEAGTGPPGDSQLLPNQALRPLPGGGTSSLQPPTASSFGAGTPPPEDPHLLPKRALCSLPGGGSSPAMNADTPPRLLPPHPFRLRHDARGKEALEHTDPHAHLRWSPRFCMEYLDARPWPAATAFYKTLVAGTASFADVTPLPGPGGGRGSGAPTPHLASLPGAVELGGGQVEQSGRQVEASGGQVEHRGGQENGQVQKRGGKRDAPEQETSGGDGPQGRGSRERGENGEGWADGGHGRSREEGKEREEREEGEVGREGGEKGSKWDVGETRAGVRWARKTVKVELAYLGEAFGGYQFQRDQHTVQGVLQVALRPFCERYGGDARDARGVPWKTRRERREQRRQQALQGAAQPAPGAAPAPETGTGAAEPEMGSLPRLRQSGEVGAEARKRLGQGERAEEEGKRAAAEEEGEGRDAAVFVAGRTDKGVSAVGQVCSFHTWQEPLDLDQIRAAIDSASSPPGTLRAVSVAGVPRDFHPAFSASWRRYAYLLPLLPGEGGTPQVWVEDALETEYEREAHPDACPPAPDSSDAVDGYSDTALVYSDGAPRYSDSAAAHSSRGFDQDGSAAGTRDGNGAHSDRAAAKSGNGSAYSDNGAAYSDGGPRKSLKAAGVDVGRIDSMLQDLVARGPLCYTAYARNTPAHRSSGAATVCRLLRASASLVELPESASGGYTEVVAGDLPGGVPGGVPGALPGGFVAEAGAPETHCGPSRALLVELIADRFLRRMVRVLVATAVREAAAGSPSSILCQLAETGERRATAAPAPAAGLCLVQVGYAEDIPPPLGKH